MNPSEILLRGAARWLLAVLPLGVLIRTAFVWIWNPGPLVWGNLIHAHSHTAYFGWAALGLMGMILHVLPRLTGHPLAAPGATALLLRLAPVAVGGALLSLAWQGYGPVGIAFSTLNELLWYIFAYIFWQNVKGRPIREWPPALWLIGVAVALLVTSTVGTLLVIIFQIALDLADPVLRVTGVYLYLQAYSDGWMGVGLMGVAAALLRGLPDRSLAREQAWLMLVLTPLSALSLLAPYGLEGPLVVVGAAAGVGLGIAQALYLWGMRAAWRRAAPAARPWWRLAAAALVVKLVLELLPLLPGWVALARERQLVIAYLHLKLLLMFTSGLIGALAQMGRVGRGFRAFAVGSGLMVAALAAHGLLAGPLPAAAGPLMDLAFLTGAVAAVGTAMAVWPAAWRS